MANFVDSLSESGKRNWSKLYKRFKHRDWKPEEKDKRGIRLEARLEGVEEIGRLMRKPGRGAWRG